MVRRLAVLAPFALVAACGGADESSRDESEAMAFAVEVPRAAAPAAAATPAPGAVEVADGPERLIVRNVSINLTVDDIATVLGQVGALATGMGGFVVSSQVSGEEESTRGFITFRVPADRTDDALAALRAMAVRVTEESSHAQDVTEEFVDLTARLGNLERTEEQYLRLYDRADRVEDVLKVQRELTSIQGRIERLKGRMEYLERTSSTSLITVHLRPATSPEPLVDRGWSPAETARDAVRALADFGQGLANVAIRVGVFAPVWAPLTAIAAWLLWRSRARGWLRSLARRGRRAAATEDGTAGGP